MVSNAFIIFTPTAALEAAMRTADEKYLSPVSVWITKDHDKVGQEFTLSEIESAFWSLFLASLVSDEPEPTALVQLRTTCLEIRVCGLLASQ